NITKIPPAVDSNGNLIILSTDGYLYIWDGMTGEQIQIRKLIRSTCYSPVIDSFDNILIATGGCKYQDTFNATLSYYDGDLNLIWNISNRDDYTNNPQSNSHPVIKANGVVQQSSASYYSTTTIAQIRNSHFRITI